MKKDNSRKPNNLLSSQELEDFSELNTPHSNSQIVLPEFFFDASCDFSIRDKEGIYRTLKVKDIAYFMASKKHTEIHFINGDNFRINRQGIGKISKIVEKHPAFIRIHKSYIVNINKIGCYDPEFKLVKLILNSKEKKIDVGGCFRKQFEEKFFQRNVLLDSNNHKIINKERFPIKTLLSMAYFFYKTYIKLAEGSDESVQEPKEINHFIPLQ